MPDPDEMDAAFDGPDDEGETHGLLGRTEAHVPGDYDFERDYVNFYFFPSGGSLM